MQRAVGDVLFGASRIYEVYAWRALGRLWCRHCLREARRVSIRSLQSTAHFSDCVQAVFPYSCLPSAPHCALHVLTLPSYSTGLVLSRNSPVFLCCLVFWRRNRLSWSRAEGALTAELAYDNNAVVEPHTVAIHHKICADVVNGRVLLLGLRFEDEIRGLPVSPLRIVLDPKFRIIHHLTFAREGSRTRVNGDTDIDTAPTGSRASWCAVYVCRFCERRTAVPCGRQLCFSTGFG